MTAAALEALHRYTLLESPTGDAPALAALAEVLEADAVRAGLTVTRERDHLLWSLPASGTARGPILLLSHYDTVWPVGTLATMPWSIEGDVIRGPGVYDTKAGIAALLAAVTGMTGPHPEIRVIVVADEEVGSPTAGDLVRSEAGRAAAVLGLEPPHPGGDLKTGRRGSTRARITVTGVEAHAALDPDAGANAIDELIDQLLRVRAGVADRPVLLNTGTIAGGGRTNVVAGEAHADLGLRFADPADEEAVLGLLRGLRPVRAKARVAAELLSHRPTWQPGGSALLDRIRAVATGIGQPLDGRPADGAADTNTTGALGVPTVDGLAPRGGGAHARTEWVSKSGVSERIALLAALLPALAEV
ncbi:putative M20/M25/M40-family peptidase [Actinoplanes missouriensis 431]|uniref:Putative M20/M25/M40-family peptidase n=1 Tax=Actinoplanes missouriensis (strain ATCC 14538 / DSM 43046 / CBS 188.64 / JCM 3121 / NBRC 102363 / NCIMB 12654 / NRRL B-3342 / UNCC 431) TaxID=512565 RepID=I0H750_ACTM4|nr:M20/M25/M40 family metallo-hydrolase [Actinoplanes missouriensis]BAL88837.1 putative M20/M25/M40-family peptidase [Actinoplanes missouriensis 431]